LKIAFYRMNSCGKRIEVPNKFQYQTQRALSTSDFSRVMLPRAINNPDAAGVKAGTEVPAWAIGRADGTGG
jgi:hypothetical protein